MADSLYIANLEKESGKLVVTLGVMELLSRRIDHVGFFRPIVPGDGRDDNDINLIKKRYNIALDYEEMAGISHDEARALIASGEEQLLFREIVRKFSEVRKKCDFLLCEGPNIVSMSEAFDYDISIRIARELGTPTLHVTNGRNRTIAEIEENIGVTEKIYEQYQCPLLAIFVNRIDPALLGAAEAEIRGISGTNRIRLGFLPEMEGFNMPTMEEITEGLGARHFSGPKVGLQRDVHSIKVAAMSPANYIDFLEEDDLIRHPRRPTRYHFRHSGGYRLPQLSDACRHAPFRRFCSQPVRGQAARRYRRSSLADLPYARRHLQRSPAGR